MISISPIRNLRALAFTGVRRWEGMPDLPTFAESILPSVQMPTCWQGWFAPAGTPREIIDRLNREIRKALEAPKVREVMAAFGFEAVGDSPAEFRKTIETELRLFTEISAKAKIRMEYRLRALSNTRLSRRALRFDQR